LTPTVGEAASRWRPVRFKLLGGVLPTKPREALRDAFAGVTLASMNIPQVLGYTRIAGTPVVTGLYTVLLPLIAFAVFGSSRHLVVAADSATAAIFSGALSTMAPVGGDRYMALVGMLTLETGALLLLARILKAGFLADFLSRTVLVGFLAGVGAQVGVAMLGDMLGVAVGSRHTAMQLWELAWGAPLADPRVVGCRSSLRGAFFWPAGSRPAFRRRLFWLSAQSRRARSISPSGAFRSSARCPEGCRR
jgi:sulfate permease, SulP family